MFKVNCDGKVEMFLVPVVTEKLKKTDKVVAIQKPRTIIIAMPLN